MLTNEEQSTNGIQLKKNNVMLNKVSLKEPKRANAFVDTSKP